MVRRSVQPRLHALEARNLPSVTPPLTDMTEGTVAQWTGFASDNAAVTLSNDTTHVRVGQKSLRFDTASGFDTGVSYAAVGNAWDTTQVTVLDLWVFGDNNTPIGWQGNQPVIELTSAAGSVQLAPATQVMPNHAWAAIHVPLAGDATWQRTVTGSFDPGNVTKLRIHQDTWDFGFTVYYDGVKFAERTAATLPPAGPSPPAGVNPDAIKPKVLLYQFDPIMENLGGARLHQAYGWQDPASLTSQIVAAFTADSHGLVNYQVVQTLLADQHPYYKDGFQYSDATFVADWTNHTPHNGEFDYPRFIAENGLAAKIDSGELDEVWIYAGPYAGLWESAMAGAGAFWINGPTQPGGGNRAFPIMGWNFERGVAEALHSFGHRAEGTMDHIYGSTVSGNVHLRDTNWAKFVYIDKYNPGAGLGGIGNIHYPVNGQSDYDYANTTPVLSRADNWANYPDVETGAPRLVGRDDWARPDGDWQLGYMNWWYSHLPHFASRGTDFYLQNWWRYLTDVDQSKAGGASLYLTDGQPYVTTHAPATATTHTTVTADAYVDGALGRVDLYVDGQYYATDTVAPFTFDWDAGVYSTGTHTLVTKAYELQNGTEGVSAPVNVTVNHGQLLVDSAADVDDGDYSAGHLSLREAVKLAGQFIGPDVIGFAGGLGPVTLTQGELALTDSVGTTTIVGTGTQVVRRSSAAGTPTFSVFHIAAGCEAAFTRLAISNGDAGTGNGGGIFNEGTLNLTDSTISGNRATTGGGLESSGPATLVRCTVSANAATAGGGIDAAGTLTATNCTVAGNTATQDGGGLVAHTAVVLLHCTVAGNRTDSDGDSTGTGGGLLLADGTATLVSTIVAGNFRGTGTTADDIQTAGGGAVDTANSKNNLVGTGGAGGLVTGQLANKVGVADARLDALKSNGGLVQTMTLLPNSPALNGGSVAAALPTDARGAGRDAVPDIGAYEVQHPLSPVGVPTDFDTVFGPHPSPDATTAFVKGLYQATLLRAGGASEVAFYVDQLNANTLTRQQAAKNFYNSPENRGNQVKFYYRYFLNRTPSQNEVAYYVTRLQNGEDDGVIMKNFILSPEYTGQNDNTQFTLTMYYATLGRGASAAEIAYYVNPLTAGSIGREQVLANFLHSPEGIGRVVRGDYLAYLERVPTPAEVTTATNQITAGATFGSVAMGVLGGAEFFQDAGLNL